MSSHRAVLAGLAGALLISLGLPTTAAAQGAEFPDLARQLSVGDAVRVEDQQGTRQAGTVVALSPDAIVIDTGAGERRFTAAETTRIVATRRDSVWNGAVIGFGPGYLLGVQFNDQVSERLEPASGGVKNGLIGGALGALIGMAFDGARDSERDVYVAAPVRVVVAPAISRGAAGASLVVEW